MAKTPAKSSLPYRKNGIARAIVGEAVLAWLFADRLAGKSDADRAAAQAAIAARIDASTKELLELAHPSDPRERGNAQAATDAAPKILADLFADIFPAPAAKK
jgi:hypothetical protein